MSELVYPESAFDQGESDSLIMNDVYAGPEQMGWTSVDEPFREADNPALAAMAGVYAGPEQYSPQMHNPLDQSTFTPMECVYAGPDQMNRFIPVDTMPPQDGPLMQTTYAGPQFSSGPNDVAGSFPGNPDNRDAPYPLNMLDAQRAGMSDNAAQHAEGPFCSTCGARAFANQRFCPECGMPLQSASISE